MDLSFYQTNFWKFFSHPLLCVFAHGDLFPVLLTTSLFTCSIEIVLSSGWMSWRWCFRYNRRVKGIRMCFFETPWPMTRLIPEFVELFHVLKKLGNTFCIVGPVVESTVQQGPAPVPLGTPVLWLWTAQCAKCYDVVAPGPATSCNRDLIIWPQRGLLLARLPREEIPRLAFEWLKRMR